VINVASIMPRSNKFSRKNFTWVFPMILGGHVCFTVEYNIYRNGPYSPALANYYYEELDLDRVSSDVKDNNWNNDKNFTDRFLTLFKDKEPEWLEVAATLIDSTNYCENEQESLNKVYIIKSMYRQDYIDEIWDELKQKDLVSY